MAVMGKAITSAALPTVSPPALARCGSARATDALVMVQRAIRAPCVSLKHVWYQVNSFTDHQSGMHALTHRLGSIDSTLPQVQRRSRNATTEQQTSTDLPHIFRCIL